MAPFRVAVAGLVHDHVWGFLPHFARMRNVKLVGAADPNRPLREKVRKEFGVDALFAKPRELFAKVEADAVLVCASNAGSVPIVEQAAARGLHVLVEKPIAADVKGAKRMIAACTRNRVRLMVNWPIAWYPEVAEAMRLVRKGDLGHVFHARVHMAHQGPKEAGCTPYFYKWLYDARQNGAGAITDYCCYGAAVMATLWGRPKQVLGVARTLVKRNFPVDDNAMVVGIWPKHTALAQASWTQNPDSHEVLFLGVKGTLETYRGKLFRTHTRPQDFSHWGADRTNRREIKPRRLPAGRRNGSEHFVTCVLKKKPFDVLCRVETALIAQQILEAGITSERRGRRISLR